MVNNSRNKSNKQQQQEQEQQQPYNIILFLHIFSASSSSIIIEVMGSAILMQVGKHVGSIPLCASNSIRTITMYYVHVRKIHQSRISATGGILHYAVSQTHWCTCLHYRWSKSGKNISHLQYLYHFHCYDQWCLHRCCHGCLC